MTQTAKSHSSKPIHQVHRNVHGTLETDCCEAGLEWTDDGTGQRCAECGRTIADGLEETLQLLGAEK